MGQRDEITGELSERVWARLRREYSLVASEVWVDDDHRVDFVGFRPERFSPFPSSIERGEFVYVEVKSCMADFKSGHGLPSRSRAVALRDPPTTKKRGGILPRRQGSLIEEIRSQYRRGQQPYRARLRAAVPDGLP